MADWVLAAERAYVAAAVPRAPVPFGVQVTAEPTALERRQAIAAAGAIASRYLAVGTPRSFGLIGEVEDAALALVAHRTWFQPRDVRCAGDHAEALAAATGGRAVSVDEALACDIVNVHAAIAIAPGQLRRGTHVNATTDAGFDPELQRLATYVREAGLPALAAGLIDGRQLDELTIFVIDGAPIALVAR